MRNFVAILLLVVSQFCSAQNFRGIVVFGDSLSDNGNLYEYMHHQVPQSPPYYEGRFSDGPTWIEQLAKVYFPVQTERYLQNYAFGGAGILDDAHEDEELFTLKRELSTYLLAHNNRVNPDNLYFVWIGGNNYLGVPENMDETVNTVITGIEQQLGRLAKRGARRVVIMGLPNIGNTPLAKELDAETQLSAFTETHNTRLKEMHQRLMVAYPNVRWLFFDVDHVFSDIYARPSAYQINETQATCYDALVTPSSPQTVINMAASVHPKKNMSAGIQSCEGYMFFDLIHPTQQMHRLIAEYMHRFLIEKNV